MTDNLKGKKDTSDSYETASATTTSSTPSSSTDNLKLMVERSHWTDTPSCPKSPVSPTSEKWQFFYNIEVWHDRSRKYM